MEGPDGQCVRERDDAHHGGLDDQGDHLELDQHIEELNISELVGDEGLDMKQECAANAELEQFCESKREQEDDSAKRVLVVGEGVKKDWPEEEWEKKDTAITFEEWLVLELSKVYFPHHVTLPSNNYTHTPTEKRYK